VADPYGLLAYDRTVKRVVRVVDCRNLHSEEAFYDAFLRDTHAHQVERFGRNLDALWDALHGGPGCPDADEVRLLGSAALRRLRDGAFLETLRAFANDSIGVTVILD